MIYTQKIVIFEWMGLSFWGVLNFLAFNGVAGLATISHVRGAFRWGC